MPRFSTLLSFAVLTAATALPAAGQTPAPTASATLGKAGDVQEGLAAFYGTRLNGRKTASGEKYDHNALTAAHKTLPFGARVRITNARNGRSVEVRINDRGPTQPNRIIDLPRSGHQARHAARGQRTGAPRGLKCRASGGTAPARAIAMSGD